MLCQAFHEHVFLWNSSKYLKENCITFHRILPDKHEYHKFGMFSNIFIFQFTKITYSVIALDVFKILRKRFHGTKLKY